MPTSSSSSHAQRPRPSSSSSSKSKVKVKGAGVSNKAVLRALDSAKTQLAKAAAAVRKSK